MRITRAGDIRVIDPCVGANETKSVLNDDRTNARPQDLSAFAQDQLHHPRVFLSPGGEFHSVQRWRDACQIHHTPLGFGDDFLRKHKDVILLQDKVVFWKGGENNIRQVVALADERNAFERGDDKGHGETKSVCLL